MFASARISGKRNKRPLVTTEILSSKKHNNIEREEKLWVEFREIYLCVLTAANVMILNAFIWVR
jgi:hypothetical protein